jgi:hypothetical protein
MLAAVVGCDKRWSVTSYCHQQSSTVSNQTAQKRLLLHLCCQQNLIRSTCSSKSAILVGVRFHALICKPLRKSDSFDIVAKLSFNNSTTTPDHIIMRGFPIATCHVSFPNQSCDLSFRAREPDYTVPDFSRERGSTAFVRRHDHRT